MEQVDPVLTLQEAPQTFRRDDLPLPNDVSHYSLEGMLHRNDGVYPPGIKLADRGFAIAEILYACDFEADNDTPKRESDRLGARLIYIKAALIKDLPLPVLG